MIRQSKLVQAQETTELLGETVWIGTEVQKKIKFISGGFNRERTPSN